MTIYQAISSGYINIVMVLLQVEFFHMCVLFADHERFTVFASGGG
jgi:hypothetical protein